MWRLVTLGCLALLLILVPEQSFGAKPVKPAPASAVVQSLSTYAAPALAEVTMYGSGFGAAKGQSSVVVCGVRANVITWSDTAIVFQVPRDLTAPGYVGVIVNDIVSNGVYFVPFASPVVTSVSPSQARPGEQVTITGTGFEDMQGSGWVTFEGVSGQVVSWTATQIVAIVPDAAHAGYVGVVQHDLISNGVSFIPFGMPAVTALSVEYALVGDVVTITGQDFGATPGTVVLNGAPVTYDSWSDTAVTLTLPADASSGYLGVQREGVTSNGVFITVAPRLDSVSSWWGAPGSTLTLTGAGFGDGSDGWACLNGQPVSVVSWTPTSIVVQLPAGATSGLIGVVRGSWATSNGVYTVVTAPATITGVSVSSLVAGQEITITGTDFGQPSPTSIVTIGGTQTCEVVSWSDTAIVVRVPLDAAAGYLGVVKEGVQSNGWWLQPAQTLPVVTGISAWWAMPGDTVTILGTGFGDAPSAASYPVFAGSPGSIVSWSDTQVVAIVPAGAPTGYAGVVKDGYVSNGLFFMPQQPPAITAVTPGIAFAGDTVVVDGVGFRDTPGVLTVGGTEVAASTWTATSVTFVVPAGTVSGYVGVTQDGVLSNGYWLEVLP